MVWRHALRNKQYNFSLIVTDCSFVVIWTDIALCLSLQQMFFFRMLFCDRPCLTPTKCPSLAPVYQAPHWRRQGYFRTRVVVHVCTLLNNCKFYLFQYNFLSPLWIALKPGLNSYQPSSLHTAMSICFVFIENCFGYQSRPCDKLHPKRAK
jgi:hypothetical protein